MGLHTDGFLAWARYWRGPFEIEPSGRLILLIALFGHGLGTLRPRIDPYLSVHRAFSHVDMSDAGD